MNGEVISMSLIELLFWYRDKLKETDRTVANRLMHKTCNEDMWPIIESSVSDEGLFIDASGKPINCADQKEETQTTDEEQLKTKDQ